MSYVRLRTAPLRWMVGLFAPRWRRQDHLYQDDFSDITARKMDELVLAKQAQALARISTDLQQSEERARIIVETALDAIVSMDAEGRVTDWNQQAQAIFGWTRDEVLGRRLSETIIPPRDREPHEIGLKRFLETGEGAMLNTRLEVSALRKDGREIPVELAVTAVRSGGIHLFNAFIRGISERRQMEELRSHLAALVESSADAIIGGSLDGHITSWNGGAERLYGYAAAEIIGRHASILMAPELDIIGPITATLIAGKSVEGQEATGVRKDGSRLDAAMTVSPIRDQTGAVTAVAVVVRDVTERKRLEVERMSLLAAERAAREEAELGRQRAAALADASALLASSLDYETTLSNVAELLMPGLAAMCVVALVDGDGTLREVLSRYTDPALADRVEKSFAYGDAYGGPDSHGAPYRVLHTGQMELVADLTDAFLVAGAVDAEHLRLMRLAKMGSMMFIPLKARGATIGVVSLGLTKAGRRYGPADVTMAEDLARRIAAAIDASRLYQEARGAEQALRELNSDLEQRVLERTIALEAANSELAVASQHKSEFLANMSHDLRTPLNGIIGFSEVLLDADLDKMAREQRTSFLNNIQRSGRHLLGLINDILDLSKVEAGRMELFPERISLLGAIQGCVDIVTPPAVKKRITISVTCEPAKAVIFADPARFKQILYNLLSNAVKFTQEGGHVQVAAVVTDRETRLAVQDDGIGIRPEDHALAFEEFRQIDAGIRRQEEGTGLGLALIQRLARLHGGSIELESTLGRGSCFTVRLPSDPTAQAEAADGEAVLGAAADPGPLVYSTRPAVVVVEDDRAASELLTLQLTTAGYDVHHASPESALHMVREMRPLAVTLDVLMPNHDGWEILKALKAEESTRSIPVVIVSVVDSRELGLALGATDYFVKPVDKEALLLA